MSQKYKLFSLIGKNCNIRQKNVFLPQVSLGNYVKVQINASVFVGVNCDVVFLACRSFSPIWLIPYGTDRREALI